MNEPRLAAAAASAGNDEHDLLFTAVAERMRQCSADARDVPARMRACLADGAEALDRLQRTLAQARGQALSIAAELLAARAMLATMQGEVLRTQASEQRAQHLALHDDLTRLPNRSQFQARLCEAIDAARPDAASLAVLFIDLDSFKPINDRHGHAVGDELLCIVAQRLSRAIRGGDMVCRLGGDEFACLLRDSMGRMQLSQLAAKLFDAVSAPMQVGALKLTVRPSIGIAVCPYDGDNVNSLLQRADAAMYRAKRRQLGFAFFDKRDEA